MMYQKSCPRCHRAVKGGHGAPIIKLGTPIKECEFCGFKYLDNDVLEWSIVPTYRKIGFCFANNRWAIILLAAMVGMLAQSVTLMLTFALLATAGCSIYALNKGKQSLPDSSVRTKNAIYVKMLIKSGYEVASRIARDTGDGSKPV